MKNASASASGTYRCISSNRVGTEDCILYLNVTPREYPTTLLTSLNSAGFPLRSVAPFKSVVK